VTRIRQAAAPKLSRPIDFSVFRCFVSPSRKMPSCGFKSGLSHSLPRPF
jgi:hypothetical protein